jgi:predicted AAA+ superfamily ATPase
MYARLLKRPENSIFLFGPRGTGKSTWIKQHFEDAVLYDFLDTREALRMERNPGTLSTETERLPERSWVILDEVQKVPAVLDEVHRLIESRNLRFVLCGSSARKLKRGGADLLAGRAVMKEMFPLTSAELGDDFDLAVAVTHGTLPTAVQGRDPEGFLTTYADAYLNEEIRAEALTRNVGAFSRFLEIAARQNGQVTNVSNIARDAAVARTTVQNYFDILVDTLIGYWLEPWKLKRSTKQVSRSKFFLFDTGVARALSGRLPYPPTTEEEGPLFETLLFNEIRAFLSYNELRYRPYFWRTYDGTEVDFLCETREGFVAVEMKSAKDWRKKYCRGLLRLRQELLPAKVQCYGVYRGKREAKSDGIDIVPAEKFLSKLWNRDIIR